MPLFILNNKKIGKRVIISPKFILSDYSRKGIGIKWIVEAALKRKGKFSNNLYLEILEAFNDKGSVKKRQKDLNLVVLTNKSNLKYRW
jgi:ribosomal protein S7